MNNPNTTIQAAFFNILFVNDIAVGLLVEAEEALRKSKHYKHTTKRNWRKVMDESIAYQRTVNKAIGYERADFFANANDLFTSQVEQHLETLYYCIKQAMDKQQLDNAELYARIEMARVLIHFCTARHEFWRKQLLAIPAAQNKAINKLSTGSMLVATSTKIDYLCITAIKTNIDRFCDDFYRTGITVNLSADNNCRTAIKVLIHKLQDHRLTIDTSEFEDRKNKSA